MARKLIFLLRGNATPAEIRKAAEKIAKAMREERKRKANDPKLN